MPQAVEFAVIADDVRWVEADLIILKHAAGFHGADAAIANVIVEGSDLMTIHGPGFGLEVSVAFLAQLAGIITALATNSFPPHLQGISFVERDTERAALLALLLRYRLAGEHYARSSTTGAIHMIDVEQIQQSHYNRVYAQ